MLKIIISLIILLISITGHAEEDWTKRITPEITLRAIILYRADPTSEESLGALSIATNFAEKSSKVMVELRQEYLPWKLGEIDPDLESKFIGAFIAGNIEYQLTNKLNKNTPIAGVKLVLYTYKKLREKNIIPKYKKFESWISMEKKGELLNAIKI